MPPYSGGSTIYPQMTWTHWYQAATTSQTVTPLISETYDPWSSWYQTVSSYRGTGYDLATQAATAWSAWQVNGTVQWIDSLSPGVTQSPVEVTAAQQRQMTIRATQSRARAMRKRVADRRARDLLVENLTDVQRAEYERDRSFTVVTADGVREYTIRTGTAGNVVLKGVKDVNSLPISRLGTRLGVGARFCMHVYHPEGIIPHEDNMLAQKLLLESEGGEAEFLALANVS
jgi:hypothetical protein